MKEVTSVNLEMCPVGARMPRLSGLSVTRNTLIEMTTTQRKGICESEFMTVLLPKVKKKC